MVVGPPGKRVASLKLACRFESCLLRHKFNLGGDNMRIPSCCCDCDFEGSCNSAMYANGCAFYPYKQKSSLGERVKDFFSKFFI